MENKCLTCEYYEDTQCVYNQPCVHSPSIKSHYKEKVIKFQVGDYVYQLVGDVDDGCKLKPSGEPFKITGTREDSTNGTYYLNDREPAYSTELLPKYMKLWTLEDANDDEWVFILHRNFAHLTQISQQENLAETAKCGAFSVVPYLGQTAKQLGLER